MAKITNITLDEDLFIWLSNKAKKEERSLSAQIRFMLNKIKKSEK